MMKVLPRGSNPTLAYLYRSYLARHLLCNIPVGKFLEIGVGSGRFYEELENRGFSGLCVDLNPELIQKRQIESRACKSPVQFQSLDFFSLQERFDLLIAFEVLEHYPDDQACLRKWESLLQPKGALIFSVPAHMSRWTGNDMRAGHARRYEKSELIKKLSNAGFRIQEFWCYGFPMLNWTYPLSSLFFRKEQLSIEAVESAHPALLPPHQPSNFLMGSQEIQRAQESKSHLADFEKTFQSGTGRFPWLSKWIFHETLWLPFLQLQRPFLRRDLGVGYIVKCRKIHLEV